MKFANVWFTSNTLHFTDQQGIPREEDFFNLLIRWAHIRHEVSFTKELSQIESVIQEPTTMTFKNALPLLPDEARKTAVQKALHYLLPKSSLKTIPRKAPAVLRKIGKAHKISLSKDNSVSELFATILNCVLVGYPIPAPQKRRRTRRKRKSS